MTLKAVEASDLVDFCHRISRNHKARGLHVVLQLAGLGGAGDHTADPRVLQDPRHGKHRQVRAELAAGAHDLMLDVTIAQVILRLEHGNRVQVVAVDDALGLFKAGRTPLLGNAIVQDLALGDQVP